MESNEKWKRTVIDPETDFFSKIFQKVIKHPKAQYPEETINIKFNDKLYMFKFEWQDESICGIDVYENI